MTTEKNFKTLYAQAQEGNQEAQSIQLNGVRDRLIRFIEKRMGVEARRQTEAEDISQSALLDLLERLGRFPEDLTETEFLAYALQLGRWRLANLFRRQRNDVGASHIPSPPAAPHPSTGIVTREDDRIWTHKLIADLDTLYSSVLNCYHIRLMTVAATANHLKISEAAVKQRLSRGPRLLQEKMSKEWNGRDK